MIKRLSIFLLSCSLAFGAISANTAWEVRTTGANTNGAGFVAGASGTDMSQFDNKNAAACSSCQSATVNISKTDAVTAGTTTITSATANFSAAIVGNIVYVAGGTGSITGGWYQAVTFTNSTTIVVDRSTGLTAGTGVTINIGGALLTIGQAATNCANSNKIFVKSGTYSITAAITLACGSIPSNSSPMTSLIGYSSSRTDQGKPTIQMATNTGLSGISITTTFSVQNFIVDCGSLGTSTGVNLTAQYSLITNIKVQGGCTTYGVNLNNGPDQIDNSEITGASSCTAALNIGNATARAIGLYIHGNSCPGVFLPTTGLLMQSIIASNTGASSDGVSCGTYGCWVVQNVIYGNGRDGIRNTQYINIAPFIRNNIITNNAGYGFDSTVAAFAAIYENDGNAYYNNTLGARHNIDDTSTNAIDGVSPYTNVLDVTMSGDPFNNAAGGDFSLNNTAGAGASIRTTGWPGNFGAGSVTGGKADFGPLQVNPPTVQTTGSAFVQ